MKETIKQLKKELIRIDNLKEGMSQGCWVSSQLRINRFKTEAKIETLKEVCKEIDKQIDNYKKLNKKFPKNQTFVDMWTSLFALELKLQGEENV